MASITAYAVTPHVSPMCSSPRASIDDFNPCIAVPNATFPEEPPKYLANELINENLSVVRTGQRQYGPYR